MALPYLLRNLFEIRLTPPVISEISLSLTPIFSFPKFINLFYFFLFFLEKRSPPPTYSTWINLFSAEQSPVTCLSYLLRVYTVNVCKFRILLLSTVGVLLIPTINSTS